MNKVEKVVQFTKSDDEKRIVYGEVYVPGDPEHRDSHEQYMSAGEIEKMAHRFMESMRLRNVDKEHDEQPGEGVIVESFIAREGDPDFAPGAWVVATKILKDETWQAVKNGEITGYSLAGVATIIPDDGGENDG